MANEQDYYNSISDYDTFRQKKYFEVRALAGWVEQSREDNEIQSIFRYIQRGLGDTFYLNGEIISGGVLSQDPNNRQSISVSAGTVWYDGIVHEVPAASLTLDSSSGLQTVGILFTTTVVTATQDSTLRDPAIGKANYGQPGANRKKIEASWVVNNANAVVAYTFNNLNLVSQPVRGQIRSIENLMAVRTYDQAGNFVVDGFDLSLIDGNGQASLIVGQQAQSSKAYVQGQQIIKIAPETKTITKSVTTQPRIQFQPYVISSNVFSITDLSEVTRVELQFTVTRTVYNHNLNGIDQIPLGPNESVVSILNVSDATSNVYTQSTDYILSGNNISWSPSSTNEPVQGGQYSIQIKVAKPLVFGSDYDYVVTTAGVRTGIDITLLKTKLSAVSPPAEWVGMQIANPSDVRLEHTFYLPRIDVVCLEADGNVSITTGQPSESPAIPSVRVDKFPLGHIILGPGPQGSISLISYDVKRPTLLDIRKFMRRIEALEYNQASKDLETSATQRVSNSISTLKGIITESFTYTAEDLLAPIGPGNVAKTKFDPTPTTPGMVNVKERVLQLPEKEETQVKLLVDTSNSSGITKTDFNAMRSYQSTLVELINQPVATTNSLTVNSNSLVSFSPSIQIFPDITTETNIDTSVIVAGIREETFSQYSALDFARLGFNPDKLISGIKPGQTISVYGERFEAGSIVEITIEGQPRTLNVKTVSNNAPESPAAWQIINTQPSGQTKQVTVDSRGRFFCWFTTPGATGDGSLLTLGSKSVVATSNKGQVASATYTGVGYSLNNDAARFISSLTAVSTPKAPKIGSSTGVALTPTQGSTTGNQDAVFTIAKASDSGQVTHAYIIFSDKDQSTVKVDVTGSSATYTLSNIGTSTRWTIILAGPGGFSEQKTDVIKINGAEPTSGTKPKVTSLISSAVASNDGQTITLSWGLENLSSASVQVISSHYQNIVSASGTSASVAAGPYLNSYLLLITSSSHPERLVIGDIASSGLPNNRIDVFIPRPTASPLAQSFNVAGQGRFIKKISVFFEAIDALAPITLSICSMAGGLPSSNLIDGRRARAVKVLDPVLNSADLAVLQAGVSADGSASTSFEFDEPIWLSGGDYAFILETNSTSYKVYAAEVGKMTKLTVAQTNNGLTSSILGAQAYQNGMMFKSPDNKTWVPYPETDLKFKIENIEFTPQTQTPFVKFSNVSLSSLNTSSKGTVGMYVSFRNGIAKPPAGTQINWTYSLDNSDPISFEPNQYVYFSKVPSLVSIKATLISENASVTENESKYLSPVLDINTLKLIPITREKAGEYVFRVFNESGSESYRYLRMIMQQSLTSYNDGVQWLVSDLTPSTVLNSLAAWSAVVSYNSQTYVSYNGLTYKAIADIPAPAVGSQNPLPSVDTSNWVKVLEEDGKVWTELKEEFITPINIDGVFKEYERRVDLGAAIGVRAALQIKLKVNAADSSSVHKTPKAKNLIVITSS